MTKTIIHLLSGGMDSTVMLYDLKAQGHSIHCVLFNYRQRHLQELEWAKHHCKRMGVLWTTLELPELKGSSLTDGKGGVIVPNRNAVFLSHAVALAVSAKADIVTYACNADDEAVFPDCRMAFVQSFNTMLITAEIPVEVCAPYIDKKKWQIADIGRQLGVNMDETWSCYKGGKIPCGECPACKKREEAFGYVNRREMDKDTYDRALRHAATT